MQCSGRRLALQLCSLPKVLSGLSPNIITTLKLPILTPIEYEWIVDIERLENYEIGGYHPIMVDEVVHNRYRIVDKLGFGGYSTIWLAQDQRLQKLIALKIGVADSTSARREITTLQALASATPVSRAVCNTAFSARDLVPTIKDSFVVSGPNGNHTCYTVCPAQGNLKDALFCRLFPIAVARALAAKLAMAVSLVHSRGFCHKDIHLRNVLVKLPRHMDELSIDQLRDKFGPPEMVPVIRTDGNALTPNVPPMACLPIYLGKTANEFTLVDAKELILSDFGEAFAPATEERLGKDCHTPISRRAPESFFEPQTPLSYPSDIWSLGTAIWEILAMKYIFSDSEPENVIVAQQIGVLGSRHFPSSWQQDWNRSEFNREQEPDNRIPCRPSGSRQPWPPLEQAFEDFVQKYKRKREGSGCFGEDETSAILRLMRGMLKFRPEDRITCEEVLESEWMVKWALPELNRKDS